MVWREEVMRSAVDWERRLERTTVSSVVRAVSFLVIEGRREEGIVVEKRREEMREVAERGGRWRSEVSMVGRRRSTAQNSINWKAAGECGGE